ncbi:MAG: Gfo/Idh/MocA family protein, partial [Gemmataceae bacterium]
MNAAWNRRQFLQQTAAVGATVFAVPHLQAQGANEKLNVGLIGCGNRGTTLARETIKLKHNLVAVCDCAPFRLEAITSVMTKAEQPKPTTYSDYRKLLEHKGLDAVIIATPDHHHRDQLIAAVQAEKDVYIEKPLTKSIDEGREMIEEVRKAKRVVQVGNQR